MKNLFDSMTRVPIQSGCYTTCPSAVDIKKLVAVLLQAKMFDSIPERKHSNFLNISTSIVKTLTSAFWKF